jgi:hypothetical protein
MISADDTADIPAASSPPSNIIITFSKEGIFDFIFY